MLPTDYIIDRLKLVAEGKRRHIDYHRTVEVADLCYTLATGVGMDKLMRRFARRESKELFNQRCDITRHIIKPTIRNISDAFQKAYRADYLRVLSYNETDSAIANQLESLMSIYKDGHSLDYYIKTRLLELNLTDPNAWIVTEWKDFDNNRSLAKPYPFEVSAKNALDFELDETGNPEYLIVSTVQAVTNSKGEPLIRFTAYLKDRSVSLDEIENAPYGVDVIQINAKSYVVNEHRPHNIGYVPAVRAGYMRDLITAGRTFVSIYDSVIPFFEKTIKVNSELDLTAALHAFPLVIRVGEDCDAQGCNGGSVYDDEGKATSCQACAGTGKKRPTSTQEEIIVSMPRDPAEVIDLSNLYTFVTPPIDIIKWQDDYVDRLTKKCLSSLFNSDVFTRSEVAETATGKNIDLQSVYDTLYPYATHWAAVWGFSVKTFAAVIKRDSGLNAFFQIRRDFKLRSYDMLIADLSAANQASPVVRASIERDLAHVMFADQPSNMLRYVVRERFNPFSGYSESRVSTLLLSDLVPREKKVLYVNMGWMLDEIEAEMSKSGVNFYTLPADRQAEILSEKLEYVMNETKPTRPVFEA